MHPVIEAAINDVAAQFGSDVVDARELGDGSVWVTVHDRCLGEEWTPSKVDVSVKILPTFPSTPPYPFYVTAGLRPVNKAAPPNLNPLTHVDGQPVAQLSLNKPFSDADTLAARLVAVLEWLRRWVR
jgi:hypothetical protein